MSMSLSSEEEAGWFISQTSQPFWQSLLRRFIASGPVPRHVAFVMDGNRRFAKTKHLGSVIKGHEKGFVQLAKILDWCNRFGIEEITVYAFSIENFKRSEEEVSGLMRLAEEKFAKLLADTQKLEEKRICFRFYGNRSLLSARLQQLMADIEEKTEAFENGRLNVCMPYTSRDEIARSFETIRQNVKEGKVKVEEINESMIDACLDSGCGGTPPDLFIRTSGEHRLSDFLMWQAADTHVYFDDVLWPEFGYFNLCKAILNYQYYRTTVAKMASLTTLDNDDTDDVIRSDDVENKTKWRMNFSGNERELTCVKA